MSDSKISINSSFAWLLTFLFVILKAFDKIDWSWWWVFSPLWISVGVSVFLLLLAGLIISSANRNAISSDRMLRIARSKAHLNNNGKWNKRG